MNPAISEEVLARIVAEVIEERLGAQGGGAAVSPYHRDQSGVIAVDATAIKTEPFPFPIPGPEGSVRLKDLLTLEESPRVGCGIMEMDQTTLPWTLKYDEVDYVISGTLELIMDGRPVRATAGQVIYIPKNTPVVFSTPDKVRFFYVVYPANWSEQ